MKAWLSLSGLGILSLFLGGCVDNHESVSVQTTTGDAWLSGAQCQLHNRKGTWFVTTPGSVSVHLGSEDLDVECTKDGFVPANEMVKSSVNYEAVFLNGAIESTVSGSAWTYPQMITVPMQPATATLAPAGTDAPIVGY
jgi:hypothetical protein